MSRFKPCPIVNAFGNGCRLERVGLASWRQRVNPQAVAGACHSAAITSRTEVALSKGLPTLTLAKLSDQGTACHFLPLDDAESRTWRIDSCMPARKIRKCRFPVTGDCIGSDTGSKTAFPVSRTGAAVRSMCRSAPFGMHAGRNGHALAEIESKTSRLCRSTGNNIGILAPPALSTPRNTGICDAIHPSISLTPEPWHPVSSESHEVVPR